MASLSPETFAGLARSPGAAASALYHQLDTARRWQGRLLDAVGLAPQESPAEVVLANPMVTLKSYHDSGADGPALLLVPAPIKRAYVWDLLPGASVVRACLRSGARVYLAQWEAPDDDQQDIGLAGYADHALATCLDAIDAETGKVPVIMLGHSLGGTLAAICATLHPERLRGLVLLGAPLHFGVDSGAFAPALASAPQAGEMTANLGNPPGSFLSATAVMMAPQTFIGERIADLMSSVVDPEAFRTHMLVERWSLDEVPLSRQLFEEVVELLYREDCLTQGTLLVGDQHVAPENLTMPLLNVIEAKSQIVPPSSVVPFHEAAGSEDKHIIWYPGDVGVGLQHVGMLVGRYAHQHLWPEILEWARHRAGVIQTH